MLNLFLDAEWFPSGRIYLLGYAYSINTYSYLKYGQITSDSIFDMIADVTGSVYFYGPDIGVIFRHTGINIRNYRDTVNLLTAVRRVLPGLSDYRLTTVEEYLGLPRTTVEIKEQRRLLSVPQRLNWKTLVRYNREDVLNLIRIKRKLHIK